MKNTFLLIISCMTMPLLHAQTQTVVVETGNICRVNIPVGITPASVLSKGAYLSMKVTEITGNQRKPVLFQYDRDGIYWLLDGINEPNTTRTFEISKIDSAETTPVMQIADNGKSLTLTEHNRHLLQYNYATVYPPEGVDTMYRRSGFIHPLWAPDGQIITNIHPKDHIHHVGIWNPWTHTTFEGRETDFWNLQKKEGTVRFVEFRSQTSGSVWCGFRAIQDHIAINDNKEKVAMDELWDIRAYNSGTDSSRNIWDFTSVLSCGESPIELLQYRYGGGFALRATAAWNATNSTVLTSEGNTRINADSTRARWIKITGNAKEGQAGILILCAPYNFDAPQLLRVWPENSERGEIMMNYSPTKMKPLKLEPGGHLTQCYRVMVYENDITVEEAENAWQSFVHPPIIKYKDPSGSLRPFH
jgi:hypothetical protein